MTAIITKEAWAEARAVFQQEAVPQSNGEQNAA
jgi:hypothetical protein